MAAATSQEPCVHGYLSAQHKKTFTITVGILGAVFFVAQFIIPFIVMVIAMPTMMTTGVVSMKNAQPAHGTYWAGKVWYPQYQITPEKSEPSTASLMTLPANPSKKPEHVADLPLGLPWLLADQDRLWVIASKGVGYFQNGRFTAYPDVQQLGDFTRPFLHNGSPAIIEDRPEGLRLMVFRNNAWKKELDFEIFSNERLCCVDHLQLLSEAGKVHAFLKYKETIYYRNDLFGASDDSRNPWQAVAPAGSAWTSLILGGNPVVFIHQGNGNAAINGYRKIGDRWEAFVSYPQFIVTSIGAFPTEQPGGITLVTEVFPGSLKRISINGEKITAETKYGDDFPFPKGFMALMMVPQGLTMLMPLILAVIFSALMHKHRIMYHETTSARKPYASLTRRAFAQIIDAIIMILPLIFLWVILMSSFFGADDPFYFMQAGFLKIISIFIGVFLWMLLCIIIFSVMEGRLGYSPGKRLLGIRVLGTDLQLCGFWRALVRNLLMFVDGFFNFMVGIMVVALTEHWQRIGDMAARTVVVDTKKR
jgi:uncharacterized RDD family membrane protein YckC